MGRLGLSEELANAIVFVASDEASFIISNLVKTDEGKSFVLGMQALKRIGQPDDVGSVVAFLASQDARWITGDTIHVDAARSSEVCRRKRTLAFLLLDLSSAHEGDNWYRHDARQSFFQVERIRRRRRAPPLLQSGSAPGNLS